MVLGGVHHCIVRAVLLAILLAIFHCGSPCRYLLVGICGAWAYPHVTTDNILNVMSRPEADFLTKVR